MSTLTGRPNTGGELDQVIAPVPRVAIQAFCETHDCADVMGAAAEDRRLAKAHIKIQMGGTAAAVEAYHDASTPNVLIVQMSGNRRQIMTQLDQLAEVCDADTKVVIIGDVNDITLYRDIMSKGVSDYLTPPLDALDIVRAISQLYANPSSQLLGRAIAVVGAKGGVGASTIAHNLSWALSRNFMLNTCVVDFDLAFGTAGLNFNQDPTQGLAEAIFGSDRLDASMLDRLLSTCSDRLSLLAAPATLDRTYDFTPDQCDPVLDLLRSSMPAIVYDVPHQWTGWSRRAISSADDIVIVVSPDLANLRNAKNLMDLLKAVRPNDAPPRYLVNMAGVPKRPEIKLSDLSKALEGEPIATIPFDPQLFGTAANNGQMISEVDPNHKIAHVFVEIAQLLTGKTEQKAQRTGVMAQLGPVLDVFASLRKRA